MTFEQRNIVDVTGNSRALLQQAEQLVLEGKISEAREMYNGFYKTDSLNFLFGRALCDLYQGKKQDFVNHIKEALTIFKSDHRLLILGGLFALQEGDAQSACHFFKEAYAIKPDDQILINVKYAEAFALLHEGKPREAVSVLATLNVPTDYPQTVLVISAATILELRGAVALLCGDLVQAEKYYQDALRINPSSSVACTGIADTFFIAELYKEAKTMYEWGVKNDSKNKAAINGLATVNEKLGLSPNHNSINETQYQAMREKIVEMTTKAYELFNQNLYEEAINVLSDADEIELDSNSKSDNDIKGSIDNIRGFCYLYWNKIERARQCFEYALSLNPSSSQACTGLGEILCREGNLKSAHTMFEKAVRNNPLNELAKYELKKMTKAMPIPQAEMLELAESVD